MGQGNVKLNSGLNLLQEAQKHYELIQEFNFSPNIFTDPFIKEALRRYELLWLPLVKLYPNERLVPPLDVQLMWVVHLHNPSAYEQDCMNLYGRILDHSLPSPEDLSQPDQSTVEKWQHLNLNEPFMLAIPPEQPIPFHSKFKSNIEKALNSDYRQFFRQVSLPHFRDTKFLQAAVQSYFSHAPLDKISSIIYPYDRGFIWKTHMLFPQAYKQDVAQLHTILRNPQLSIPQSLIDRTQGAMYRGGVAPVVVKPFDNEILMGSDRLYRLSVTSMRLENLVPNRFYKFVISGKSFQTNAEHALFDLTAPSKSEIVIKTFRDNDKDNMFLFDAISFDLLKLSLDESIQTARVEDLNTNTPIESIYARDISFPGNNRYKEGDHISIPFNMETMQGQHQITIGGSLKMHCMEVVSNKVTLNFIGNHDTVVHFYHYGKVLNQPEVMAPYSLKLKEAPCSYLNLVVTDRESTPVLKCRMVYSGLQDYYSVEVFDLADLLVGSANTLGKESIPGNHQVAEPEKCCTLMDASERIYIIRGTNCDCGLLKVVEDDDGHPIFLFYMCLRNSTPRWERIFDSKDGRPVVYCQSKDLLVDFYHATITLTPTGRQLPECLSMGALIISIFCSTKFLPPNGSA